MRAAVSRILSPPSPLALAGSRYGAVTTIPLASPSLAGSSDRPGGLRRAVCPGGARIAAPHSGASLFGLAPCGVLPATDLTAGAVRSYRTFSPLPASALRPFGALRGYGVAGPRLRGLPRRSTTKHEGEGRRYIFCATVLQVALTGRYPAHCPAEFGLSSHAFAQGEKAGDRLACCELLS